MKTKEEVVKVHRASRPKFECSGCHRAFPSVLDLEEHKKYDHATNASIAG